MTFAFLLLLVILLQVAHWRLLRVFLGMQWNRWIVWGTLGLNAFLALYVGLRLTGLGNHGVMTGLRPVARLVEYFQVVAALNVLMGALSLAFWWVVRKGGRTQPMEGSRRWFLGAGASASVGIFSAGLRQGGREAYGNPVIRRVDMTFADLPAGFHGLRIAFLSDLHAGPLVSPGTLGHWRRLVEREHPDLVLFGGDFVDSLPEEIGPLCEAFRGLRPPLGCFGVLGNHDFFTDAAPILAALEAEGIHCLENRSEMLQRHGDRLALVGLQDPMATVGRGGIGPDPQAAVQGLDPRVWRLCLCHRPSRWPDAKLTGARLTLSGHTHGGQMNLLPGLNSARILGPYTHGHYQEGPHHLYVSAGLGVVGLPLRLGAPPEFSILTLLRG